MWQGRPPDETVTFHGCSTAAILAPCMTKEQPEDDNLVVLKCCPNPQEKLLCENSIRQADRDTFQCPECRWCFAFEIGPQPNGSLLLWYDEDRRLSHARVVFPGGNQTDRMPDRGRSYQDFQMDLPPIDNNKPLLIEALVRDFDKGWSYKFVEGEIVEQPFSPFHDAEADLALLWEAYLPMSEPDISELGPVIGGAISGAAGIHGGVPVDDFPFGRPDALPFVADLVIDPDAVGLG